jgi:hypothetical protein
MNFFLLVKNLTTMRHFSSVNAGATLIVYSAPVIGFSIFSLLFLHLKRAFPEER